jgi:uncharacterized protein YbaR (Trm112 family)
MNPLQQQNQVKGYDDHQWVQVTETLGVSHTGMVIEYLRGNGIHAIAIESTAIGLITGANSTARVMVPEEEAGQTLYLLEPEADIENDEDSVDEFDSSSSVSGIDKAVLGATALALSPLGLGIAYAISRTMSSEEDEAVNRSMYCPTCGIGLELSEEELLRRQFTCPDCDQVVRLDDQVVCPKCRSELDLDSDEQARGWYICPECRWAVRIKHF